MKKPRYILFNKPYGVLCQFLDKSGRPALKDYIDVSDVYPVGRLDLDSEGLVLLTDDGKFQHDMADPRKKVWKKYLVQVEGTPNAEQIQKLEEGVVFAGKKTLPAKVKAIETPVIWERAKPIRFRATIPTSWLEISICEGRNRQVRRMVAAVGLPCLRLVRMEIGEYKLEGLGAGECRAINPKSQVLNPKQTTNSKSKTVLNI
ncbi:MAG: pseudouridine synthase [Candidatus Margulisiibacteriota bacterium]